MKLFWASVVLLLSCESQPRTVYRCDKAVEERVLLACLDRAKHPPLAPVAGNDAAEVVSECAAAARDVACGYVREDK